MTGRAISDSPDGHVTKKVKLSDAKNGSNQPVSCARWCNIEPDGTFILDEAKVKSFLSQNEQEDARHMQNVLQGKILAAKVYPLIFDTAQPSNAPDVAKLRTLSYFRELLADADANGTLYQSLADHQKCVVAVGLRDLHIARSMGLLNEQDKYILGKLIQTFNKGTNALHMAGMKICFHPSKDFSVLKFIEDLDEKVGRDASTLYAQVMETPRLFAVFVDPMDLSYHNLENIVHLDKWLQATTIRKELPELNLFLKDPTQTTANREIFTGKLVGDAAPLLKDLSALDLYVPPLNNNTRGGERFIFHSSILSNALTESIKSSGLLEKLANGHLNSTFEFVNYVFRCNKFVPGDSDFHSHLDTPYYDSLRSQVSKYTLLIYLNGGRGDPMLRLKDVSIEEVEDMTWVIFDQRYEHEGRPFVEGMKTFIRTELVFKDSSLRHDDKISALFSQACYMSGQSMFDESLASHAHECFERANALHWAMENESTMPSVYLHKQFHGITFLTNGYIYWFQKNGAADVKSCALVASMDYLNCKLGQESFRSLAKSTKVQNQFTSAEEIWSFLASHTSKSSIGLRKLKGSDVESLIKKSSDKPFVGFMEEWDDDDSIQSFDEDGDGCCPTHSYPMFNPWKNDRIMDCYEVCCNYARKALFAAPLLLLNEEVVLNDDNIVVTGDKVFIVRQIDGKALPSINFAACWSGDEMPGEFIQVGQEIPAPQLLLPPITFHDSTFGLQLSLDFFRNDWMVEVDDSHSIPVPDIVERPEYEKEFGNRVLEVGQELDGI